MMLGCDNLQCTWSDARMLQPLTVHAKHDVRVDMAGHDKRDLERPRP
jgi:hypothetical protein